MLSMEVWCLIAIPAQIQGCWSPSDGQPRNARRHRVLQHLQGRRVRMADHRAPHLPIHRELPNGRRCEAVYWEGPRDQSFPH